MQKNSQPFVNTTNGNVASASKVRASTAEEIEYLHSLLQQCLSPRKRVLKAMLNTLVMWGGALLGFLLVSGIASYLAPYSDQLTYLLALSGLSEFVMATAAMYALFSTYRWLSTSENTYPLILKDINDAQVLDETYQIQEVCRFQEPEMGGFIYFLKISERAVFVTYDYQSQRDPDNVYLVQDTLILSQASHCGHYVQQRFSGESIAVNATHPMTVPPAQWPLPDSWLSVPWSQLTSVFNQKQ